MPAEPFYPSIGRVPTPFGVPRDVLMLAVAPAVVFASGGIVFHQWLISVFAAVGLVGAIVFFRILSRGKQRWFHQWAESHIVPRALAARQSLRGRQVSHR